MMSQPSASQAPEFVKAFEKASEEYEKNEVEALCNDLISHVQSSDDIWEEKYAKQVLQALRANRYFDLLKNTADALLCYNEDRPLIRRMLAQALIDTGNLTGSIDTLSTLLRREDLAENDIREAKGMLGRAYKQAYVDAAAPGAARNVEYLNGSLALYREVYEADNNNLWHGINAVAVAARAARDGVFLIESLDVEAVAEDIFMKVRKKIREKAEVWDYPTAAEACYAVGDFELMADYIGRYVDMDEADAFEIASTLRQFREVWQFDESDDAQGGVLSMLTQGLLQREGGGLEMSTEQVRKMGDGLEASFGTPEFVRMNWIQDSIARARGIGNVLHRHEGSVGTGFLVPRAEFFGEGDGLVFMTNFHVINEGHPFRGHRPEDVTVTFQSLGTGDVSFEFKKILWSSPISDLDCTILSLKESVSALVEPFPIQDEIRGSKGEERIYVIGHPAKSPDLMFSFYNNKLVDFDDNRIHYRTPTEPGSSGSPVFDKNWKLIGLHHAGKASMKKLHGKTGTYEANEGLRVSAIRHGIANP